MSQERREYKPVDIPQHWQFARTYLDKGTIEQVDTQENFLAISHIAEIDIDGTPFKEYSSDYFFNADGRISISRLQVSDDRRIVIRQRSSDMDFSYRFSGKEPALKIGISDVARVPESDSDLFEYHNPNELKCLSGSAEYDAEGKPQLDLVDFRTELKGSDRPPIVSLEVVSGNGSKAEDFGLRQTIADGYLSGRLFRIPRFKDVLLDLEGQTFFETKGFRFDWRVDENQEGNPTPLLVFTQTYLPTGTSLAIQTPLKLDLAKLSEIFFSKPPYAKDESGKLMAPWKNIVKVLGTSLSYTSYCRK